MSDMLTTRITDFIEFAYCDSGPPPNKSVYDTIILIHGHTYHSGTLKPMIGQAHDFDLRVILVNRRLYPGSTPYTQEEFEAFQADKSVEDLTKAFFKQGDYLLSCINNIIRKYNLQSVLLVAWSLGTAFLNAMVASIHTAGEDLQSSLRKAVKSIVWWDTPATAHGFPDPPTGGWIPLYDPLIKPEERGTAFGHWLSEYYPHKDLDKKDCNGLIYRNTTQIRPATFSKTPFKEFLTKVDLTAGINGDNAIADSYFRPVVKIARELATSNSAVRAGWGDVPFFLIYGDQSPYNVQWAVWMFEKEAEKSGLPIKTIQMSGANHFAMEEDTKLVLGTLKICI